MYLMKAWVLWLWLWVWSLNLYVSDKIIYYWYVYNYFMNAHIAFIFLSFHSDHSICV